MIELKARGRALCEEASLLDIGYSIASIIAAFFPDTSINQPYAIDFCRTLLQNFGYDAEPDAALSDDGFRRAVQSVLKIRLPHVSDYSMRLTPPSPLLQRQRSPLRNIPKRDLFSTPSTALRTSAGIERDRQQSPSASPRAQKCNNGVEAIVFGEPLNRNQSNQKMRKPGPRAVDYANTSSPEISSDEGAYSVKDLEDRVSQKLSMQACLETLCPQIDDVYSLEAHKTDLAEEQECQSGANTDTSPFREARGHMHPNQMHFGCRRIREQLYRGRSSHQRARTAVSTPSPDRILGSNSPSPPPSPSIRVVTPQLGSPRTMPVNPISHVEVHPPVRTTRRASLFPKWMYSPYE